MSEYIGLIVFMIVYVFAVAYIGYRYNRYVDKSTKE